MHRTNFTFLHLKHLVCHQPALCVDMVRRNLVREAGSAQSANRIFVLPAVLDLEQDGSDGIISEPLLLRGARRLQQVAEELAGDIPPGLTARQSVIVGTFGSMYNADYSLLKTLLLCRDYDVIDLGTNLEIPDFLAASVQSAAPEIYITAFTADELGKIPELVEAYDNYTISCPRLIVGGAAIRCPDEALPLPSSVEVYGSLKDLFKNIAACNFERMPLIQDRQNQSSYD